MIAQNDMPQAVLGRWILLEKPEVMAGLHDWNAVYSMFLTYSELMGFQLLLIDDFATIRA